MAVRAAIVTANIGQYDNWQPGLAQDIQVDWIAYTDDPSADVPAPWQVRYAERNGEHPNLFAKGYKLLPQLPHRYVIWIDANVRVQSSKFVSQAISYIHDGVAVHKHPFRTDIYQEAIESVMTPKYEGLPIIEQVCHYRKYDGFPDNGGLYACGVVAWDLKHPKSRPLGRMWMQECEKWTHQDQLSFPVVARRLGVTPGTFPFQQYKSQWLRIFPHP